MVSLSTVDTLLIISYFVAVVAIGFRSARKTTTAQVDFLLAGRSLTLPIFVMTLVSTWYGGILGVGEFTYRYGLSNWLVQGVPYYVFAGVFAFALAKRIRATNLFSIPDKLHASYDKKTALLGAFLTFVLMTPAPYILMLSVFLQILFGWDAWISVVIIGVVGFSYLHVGGLRADIATDVFQFVLMFCGFAVVLPFAVSTFGGLEFLRVHLPPLHLEWHGGHSAQYILVWFFIALWTLVDPAFHQRCYAARDGETAKRGILVSIFFWFLFDALTVTTGLYARAALPDLSQPIMSFPLFAESVLPSVAKGIFYVGMLATIMSTLNTLGFVSAQTLGRDLILRFRLSNAGSISESATRFTQLGLVVSFLLAVIMALAMPSVIQMWYTIGTVAIPGLLVPLVSSYFNRLQIPSRYAFLSMGFGWITSLIWLIAGRSQVAGGIYPFGIEPMYPGLAASCMFWVVGKVTVAARR
jgi:SSS family solute:Na+ symporter